MNFKNLAMWAVIVFLTIGLYNMFKNPQSLITQEKNIIFSEFLSEVDNGRIVQVEIQGNNIRGIMSNGEKFSTYSPNDPNLIEKTFRQRCKYFCISFRGKNAFSFRSSSFVVSNVITNSSLDIFYETDARRKRRCNGFW